MSRLILFFQSKVALAIIGTVLFGGCAALLASASFSPANQTQTQTNIAANANTTVTPKTSPSGTTATLTPGVSPTATPTPRIPTPTPTAGINQPTNLTGTVTSVDTTANLFKVRSGGVTKTVTITSQTVFTGACTSLSGMQTQWKVVVQGAYQADGTFAATAVNSRVDD